MTGHGCSTLGHPLDLRMRALQTMGHQLDTHCKLSVLKAFESPGCSGTLRKVCHLSFSKLELISLCKVGSIMESRCF